MRWRIANQTQMILLSTFAFISLHPTKLQQFCSTLLPTEPMRTIKSGSPILGRVLADILRGWLIDAVRSERRKKNPEMYRRQLYANLTREELKSETHRVICGAIKAVRDNEKEEEANEYGILNIS